MRYFAFTLAALCAAGGLARAEPDPAEAPPERDTTNDGYCDYVEGVAAATSDVQLAPDIFAQFGYVEQAPTTINPDIQNNGLRLIIGAKYSLSNVFVGLATRDHAHADCRRHIALDQVRGGSIYRALEARLKVLDAAITESDKMIAAEEEDLKARRTSLQEATAMRIRAEELRQLSIDAHRQMSTLPAASSHLGGALKAFQQADADVEAQEGKLRRLAAFDVSVRFGADEFLDTTQNPTPYFAVVAASVNLGALFQGSANERAAKGRHRLIRTGHDPLAVDATSDRLKALLAAETKRAGETAALEGDLQRQLETLDKVGGEDSKKYRQTVWFDYIKVKAEHAYLKTHLASLHEVLGDDAAAP